MCPQDATSDIAFRLPRTLVNELLHHAQVSPDNEVCGLIAKQQGRATRIYPIPNAARDTAHRFELDPHSQIEAMRKMRDSGEELFAIYHSHPDSTALPSTNDLQETGYPDALYLIIALGTKGVLEMRGYHVEDGRAREVELEIF
jgi:proteasome lid subunit RPN8/RPN11